MSAPGKKVHTNRKKFLYYYVSYITVLCLVTQLCQILCDLMDYSPPGSSVLAGSPDKNTGVGCHAFLQGIFLTQGSNPGLPHCRWIPYHLSHQGSPSYISYILYIFSFLHRSVGKESAYVSQICSRLENPRDKGAWWAAVYGITQSQTWLKQLSSGGGNILLYIAVIFQLFLIIAFIAMQLILFYIMFAATLVVLGGQGRLLGGRALHLRLA